MRIDVIADTRDLINARKNLTIGAAEVAITRSINKALLMGRTAMKREILKQYKLKPSVLGTYDENGVIEVNRARADKLTGTIEASSRPIAMSLFEPVFRSNNMTTYARLRGAKYKGNKRPPRRRGMSVEIIRGNKDNFPSAFAILSGVFESGIAAVARGKYGNDGFSWGKDRKPIKFLKSKSVFWSALNEKTIAGYGPQIESIYFKELTRNIELLIEP